jgi:peroxiredoxin Q/BCP
MIRMPKTLHVGDTAPAIDCVTDEDKPFTLASLKGKQVILYFYPKADTPGCTVEANGFKDESKNLAKKNAVVVGVSPDTCDAQAKFKTKFDLPFTLLADKDHQVAEDYDVWKEKSNYGRTYMGVERTTFVIDEKGKIKKIYNKVKTAGHAQEVLADL